eukprot:TRINITY_DN5642_c0_g1_i1.p1 TRINITY_DN5642_c0_g1~~TRINITY_DN5642_c0_g1_i1.p1  ORF type:complete len:279 (-),score=61.91 TRINITY_DN5642_c0_g1_i1:171-1007(-)
MQSPAFGDGAQQAHKGSMLHDADGSPSAMSTVSTWTEKAWKFYKNIPFAMIVLVATAGVAACVIGMAFHLWFVSCVAAMITILCRFLYLLQWEHKELTAELMERAAVPIIVQPPAIVPSTASRLPADRSEPVSELDLTGFAGSLGFGPQRSMQAVGPAASQASGAGAGGSGTLHRLQQHALAKEYLLISSALAFYRNTFGPLEPETPKAIDNSAESKTPRSPRGPPSPSAAKTRSREGERSGEFALYRPKSWRKEEAAQEEPQQEARPRTTFALFGGR